jgi:hypothetical protein
MSSFFPCLFSSGARSGSPARGFALVSRLSLRRAALAGAVCLAAALAQPAAAQQVLVSNFGAGNGGGDSMSPSSPLAGAFTTGSSGATLDSVTFKLYALSATGFTVGLYADNAGVPGTQLETLSGPSTLSSPINYTYTSAGYTLAANATYWLVLSTTSGSPVWQLSADTSETGATGWLIGDSSLYYVSTPSPHWQSYGPLSLSVSGTLTGAAIPEPGTWAALAGVVALGAAAWWRRAGRGVGAALRRDPRRSEGSIAA